MHTLGAWSAGMREFTANEPIREPGDLDGLRMRFPNSPQFLMNAKALGADATEVAYEELFLALQQGTVDGQEYLDHQHRGQQPPGRPGLHLDVGPPGELQPGDHRGRLMVGPQLPSSRTP